MRHLARRRRHFLRARGDLVRHLRGFRRRAGNRAGETPQLDDHRRDGAAEPADLVVRGDARQLNREVTRGDRLGGLGELVRGSGHATREEVVQRHEQREQAEDQCGERIIEKLARGGEWRAELRERGMRRHAPASAIGEHRHGALRGVARAHGGRRRHGRRRQSLGDAPERGRLRAEHHVIGGIQDVDPDARSRLAKRVNQRRHRERELHHADRQGIGPHDGGQRHHRLSGGRVERRIGMRESVTPRRLPPRLVALHEIGAQPRRDRVESVRLREQHLGGAESRQHRAQVVVCRRLHLQRALGHEALFQVGDGHVDDAECLRPRRAGAGGGDDLRRRGHELGLPHALGQRRIHDEQAASRGVGHAGVALSSDHAVQRGGGPPRQQRDRDGASQADGKEKAPME